MGSMVRAATCRPIKSYNGPNRMYISTTGFSRDLRRAQTATWVRRRALVTGALAGLLVITSQAASALSPADARNPGIAPATVEQRQVHQAAAALATQYAGQPQALLDAGEAALRTGRNEATIAAMLRLRWVGRLDAGLERYGGGLHSSHSDHVALAVAGVQHYSELIHKALLGNGPERLITVSLQDQRLVAYERGQVVVDTLVTTGRPTLPTDIGAMDVLKKDSPWTMHSPWPKGSPDWYPDTQVKMVLWFTTNGEGLHDASWQPAGTYGPGSTDGPFASHGCIHVPPAAEAILFNWATLGTPVVVYPGDGTTLAAQTSQESVDAAGKPITGIRGA